MSKKMYIKPSKTALKAGLIVSILFFIFGIVFIGLLVNEPESYIGIGFLIFWLIVIAIIIRTFWTQLVHYDDNTSGLNYVMEVDQERNEIPDSKVDFDEKIRKLEQLKNDGLISNSEYEQKRAEILEQKW